MARPSRQFLTQLRDGSLFNSLEFSGWADHAKPYADGRSSYRLKGPHQVETAQLVGLLRRLDLALIGPVCDLSVPLK